MGAALILLEMPAYAMAALTGFAFYVWSGAAELIRGGASGRSVVLESGALALIGLLAGLLLHRP